MTIATKALGRNENERPMLLIPFGYPAENAQAYHILRKSKEDITEYYH